MSDLSDDARTLIAATRHGDDPHPSDESRVRQAVILRIGAGAFAGAAAVTIGREVMAAGAAKAATGWSALLGSTVFKLVTVAVVGGSVTAGSYLALRSPRDNPPQTPAVAPAVTGTTASEHRTPAGLPDSPSEAEPTLAVDDLPLAASAPVIADPSAREAPAGTHKQSNLRAEVAAIGSANRSLRDGDPENALRILDEHASVLNDGALREETSVARILALCELGRQAEASADARRFLQSSPSSPLVPRVRASCAFQPSAVKTPAK